MEVQSQWYFARLLAPGTIKRGRKERRKRRKRRGKPEIRGGRGMGGCVAKKKLLGGRRTDGRQEARGIHLERSDTG